MSASWTLALSLVSVTGAAIWQVIQGLSDSKATSNGFGLRFARRQVVLLIGYDILVMALGAAAAVGAASASGQVTTMDVVAAVKIGAVGATGGNLAHRATRLRRYRKSASGSLLKTPGPRADLLGRVENRCSDAACTYIDNTVLPVVLALEETSRQSRFFGPMEGRVQRSDKYMTELSREKNLEARIRTTCWRVGNSGGWDFVRRLISDLPRPHRATPIDLLIDQFKLDNTCRIELSHEDVDGRRTRARHQL